MNRRFNYPGLITLISILFATSLIVDAQKPPTPVPDPARPERGAASSDDESPLLGPMEEEMRAKRAIKLAEKEYQENLARAREAAQLSSQLRDTYKQKKVLGPDDAKKLERLEKLERRIRNDAGGSPDDVVGDQSPTDLLDVLSRVAELSESIEKSLIKPLGR